ncbi:hypothetical protein AB9F26_16380 [Falsihalocynthiibacter sp. BN13B15]|uniref:hypothetical protein n=1 Tax=Falsihalocynthiibacter sp. BN13B15 TaxID=3240871 RepID=UPI00351046B4
MTTVIMTHNVENMETWLKGGHNRKPAFDKFCKSYKVFKHTEDDRVSIVCEGADIATMKQVLGSAETTKAKEADTVVDPIDVFVEIEGGD